MDIAVETREHNGYRIRTYNVRSGSGSRDVACNSDGTVTINELVLGVNIALGSGDVRNCTSIDTNAAGVVVSNGLDNTVGSR